MTTYRLDERRLLVIAHLVLICMATLGALIVICACNSGREPRKMTDQQSATNEKTLIDTTGWSAASTNHWRNSRGGELQIVTSGADSVDVLSLDSFRDRARSEILSRGGGLISADLSTQGVGVAIAKFPQKPSGMTYEGQLVVVRDHSESRVIVRFPETGMTGFRDAAIFDSHIANLPDDVDPTQGWMSDPYDKTRRDPLMRNGADDERFDAKFPEHPLTLVRAELKRLERSL
jgi:hypothetical protein